ncbi:MAG TPA: hypothetical protein VND99_00095 [Candidatus Acidoferrales bacterium]|nr:hypothetical protein [Candidatus Acidoferrales bacterium]
MGRSKDAEPVKDPVKLLPKDRAREFGRRSFVRMTIFAGAAGTIASADKTALAIENLFNTSRTTIVPARGEVLHPWTTSIVLDLPGQNYDTDHNIDVLPSLSPLGVRMKAKLGNKGDPVTDLRKGLYDIKNSTQLETMSWFCDSSSWPLAAQVIPLVSDRIAPEYVFLASTPDGLHDIKGVPRVIAEMLLASGYGPSPALVGLTDAVQFHNPFAPYMDPEAASAETAYKQLQDLSQTESITHDFAKFLNRYNATHAKKIKLVYLLLQDPTKDPYVNETQSVRDFLKDLPIDVVYIDGQNPGHDNPTTNNEAYNAAIAAYLAAQGRR